MLQNGVSHRCACVKLSSKKGVSHHFGGGTNLPEKVSCDMGCRTESIVHYGITKTGVSHYALWGYCKLRLAAISNRWRFGHLRPGYAFQESLADKQIPKLHIEP